MVERKNLGKGYDIRKKYWGRVVIERKIWGWAVKEGKI